MASPPVLFTVEFRREMARLSPAQRQDWLCSLAAKVTEEGATPLELGEVARGCRLSLVEVVERHLGPFEARHLDALLETPRERFVRKEDIALSADDTPLPLEASGSSSLATISAPHAYLLSYRLLGLAPGDSLVELGAGSGYGAALASAIVGVKGCVRTFEIDPALAARARDALQPEPHGIHGTHRTRLVHAASNVTVFDGDAMTSERLWGDARKVVVTFAIASLPDAWLEALPDGGKLVAPVGDPRRADQRLVLVERRGAVLVQSDHGSVRYVKNRSSR